MYIEIPSTETRLCEQCPIESLPLHCDIRNSHPYSALTDPLPRILSLGGLHQNSLLRCCDAVVMGELNPATSSNCMGGVALNIATGLAALNIHTSLASRVGNDAASVALMLGERDE